MEDILAIVLIFGGLAAFMLSISPVGRAIADRIRSGDPGSKEGFEQLKESQLRIFEELDQLRQELVDVQERVDFAERLLAQREAPPGLSGDREAAS